MNDKIIRCITWNVNGNIDKYTMAKLKLINFDIMALQETHLEEDQVLKIDEKLYTAYYNNYTSQSRGVAFIVRNTINVIDVHKDNIGRSIQITIKLNQYNVRIINIYCPCKGDKEKYLFLEKIANNEHTKSLLVGDFNLLPQAASPILSQFNYQIVNKSKSSKQYTFFRKRKQRMIKRDLDHYYSKNMNQFCTSPVVISKQLSDHYPVGLNLIINKEKEITIPQNECVISEYFIKNNKQQISDIISTSNNWIESKKKILDLYNSTEIKNKSAEISNKLFNASTKQEINSAITSYEEYVTNLHDEIMKEVNQPSNRNTKYINRDKKITRLAALKRNNKLYRHHDEILDICLEFYKQLYSNNSNPNRPIPHDFHVRELNQNHNFTDITVDEISKQINKTSKSAAGPDLIPVSLYKELNTAAKVKIANFYNDLLNNRSTSDDIYQFNNTRLILIYKKGDSTNLGNYRPISITNLDYRILTGIILSRLNEEGTLNELIDSTNTYKKGVNFISNIVNLDLTLVKKIKRYVLSIDFQKAFDSIFHSYLYEVLERTKLDIKLVNFIKRIYVNSHFKIQYKNWFSEDISYDRGIKQGDSISIFLFPLVLQPLLSRISELEEGLTSTAHADDCLFAFNFKSSLKKAIRIINRFSRFSGLNMNKQKSIILCNNKRNDKICGIRIVKSFIYLGFKVSMNGIVNDMDHTITKMIDKLNVINYYYLKQKIMFLKSYVISMLYYKLQIIQLTHQQIRRINKLFTWFLNTKSSDDDHFDENTFYYVQTKLTRFNASSDQFGFNLPDISLLNDYYSAKILFKLVDNKLVNTQLLWNDIKNINILATNTKLLPLFININPTSIKTNRYLKCYYHFLQKYNLRLEYTPQYNELVHVLKKDYSYDFEAYFDKLKVKNGNEVIVVRRVTSNVLLRYEGEQQVCYGSNLRNIALATPQHERIEFSKLTNKKFQNLLVNYQFNTEDRINKPPLFKLIPKLANHLVNFTFKLIHKKCYVGPSGPCFWCNKEENKPNHFLVCSALKDHIFNQNITSSRVDLLGILANNHPNFVDIILVQYAWMMFIYKAKNMFAELNYDNREFLFKSIKKQQTTSRIKRHTLNTCLITSHLNTYIIKSFI